MSAPIKSGLKQVRPILSLTREEARRRTINLYKTWYRQIPFIIRNTQIPKTEEECYKKLREQFDRYAHVRDVRAIDVLLLKGQMDLQEVCNIWRPDTSLMSYWTDTVAPKPKDFMSKFIAGHD